MGEVPDAEVFQHEPSRPPRMIEALPYQKITHTVAAKGEFEDYPAESEVREGVHEAFMSAERYVFRIAGALGDSVLETGYANGLVAAVRKIRGKHIPITLAVDADKAALFTEYAERKGVEVIPLTADAEDPIASMHEFVTRQPEKIFAIDFHQSPDPSIIPIDMPYDPYPHLYQLEGENGNKITMVGNAFHADMLAHHADIWPEDKFGVYMQRLLGIPNTLKPREAQPRLYLPRDAKRRYQHLAQEYGIDTRAVQVGCIFQTTHPTKIYSLENWKKVLEDMKGALKQQYAGRAVNFNIMVGPINNERIEALVGEERMHAVLADMESAGVHVNFIKANLGDLKILLANQDVVVGDDAGPSHIAAHVEGGPPVVSVYLPMGFEQKTWATGKRHFGVGLTAEEKAHVDKNRFGREFLYGGNTTINSIPPERIALETMRRLREGMQHKQGFFSFGRLFQREVPVLRG